MRLLRSAGIGLALLLVGAAVQAGTVYRWVDEHGVVHFGDVPPPGKRAVEQNMPAAARPPAAAPAAVPAAAADLASKGPARIVVADHEEVSLGGAQQAVRGTVKNEGGETARGVVVAIHVSEPIQGADCLTDEITVEPSSLAAGEKGTFSAEFDNPCFFGPTQAELRPDWD